MFNGKLLSGFLFLTAFIQLSSLTAQTADEIIRMVDRRQTSSSEVTDLTMTVIDDTSRPDDAKSFRMESFSITERDDEELSVYFFREPRRMAGLAILSRNDGQWVYFPSTGRVRLLSGAARSGSVSGVGGDFSYEDLGSGNWGDNYSFTLISSSDAHWVLEGLPAAGDVNYSRILMHVDKNNFIPRRIEFYKEGRNIEKILTITEIGSFHGRENPAVIEMENPNKNSSTIIEIHDIEYDRSLEESLFHPRQFYR